jgi:hypothetical protein
MANKFVETVNSSDASIYVTHQGYTPYYNPDDKNLHDGAVRTKNGGLEYYDTKYNNWMPLPSTDVKIEIAPHVQVVLDWAHLKMKEELELEQLVAKYPALKQAKENFEIVKALVRNE